MYGSRTLVDRCVSGLMMMMMMTGPFDNSEDDLGQPSVGVSGQPSAESSSQVLRLLGTSSARVFDHLSKLINIKAIPRLSHFGGRVQDGQDFQIRFDVAVLFGFFSSLMIAALRAETS